MAKPADITPAQETAIRQKLKLQPDADISWVYDTMSEEGVRRLAGPTIPVSPTAAPKQPKPAAPKPKVTPTSTPTIPTPSNRPVLLNDREVAPVTINFVRDPVTGRVTTEAEARRRSDYRTQVQPETGMLPRFPPSAATSGQEALDKALEQRRRDVAERSFTGPAETRLTPEQGAAEIAKGQSIATAPRTPAGERRPLTPAPSTYRQVFGDNVVSDFFEAVSPQVIETAEQKRERDRQAYQATQDFFKSFSPNKPPTGEEFKKVYDSYRFYGGQDPEGFMASIMKRSGLDEAARAAFTTTSPTGQVIESPLATAGKVLSASEAALSAGAATLGRGIGRTLADEDSTLGAVGRTILSPVMDIKPVPKEALPEVSFRKEFKTEVAKGTGLLGAGSESFSKAAEYAGADKETQDLLGYVGGTLGFIGGIGVPLDLGVVQGAATGLRTATTTGKIAKELGEGVGVVGARARGFVGGATEGALDAWRITGQRTGGLKAVTREMETATRNFLNSPSVSNASATTIKLAADDGVQAAIKADREAGRAAAETKTAYDQTPYIDTLRQRFDDVKAAEVAAGSNHPITRYADFDEWAANAEKHGIDVYNSAGRRAKVLGDPPPNVRLKETEESVRRTTTGRSSVDYFDEVATGGRQNLYFNAFIDTLDPATKGRLLAGGAIKSEEFLPALDRYVNTIRREAIAAGKTPQQVDNLLAGLERELTRKGIKIPAGRISGGVKGTGGFESGLILTPKIEKALEKSYKIDLGRRTLNDFAARTGITGQTTKIGNVFLSPTEAKEVTDAVKRNGTLTSIRNRLVKNNGDVIKVSDSEVKALKKYFLEPFQKERALPTGARRIARPEDTGLYLRPTETYSPFQVATIISRLEKTGEISAEQFNDLIRGAIGLESSGKVTAKSATDIAGIAGRLGEAPDKAAELSYFVRNVLTPKDLQESGLAAILIDLRKKVGTPAPTKNPVANKVIEEVNARMGALGDRFKAKMRKKISVDKLDRPTAFSDTIVEEFTKEGLYKPEMATRISPTGVTQTSRTIQRPFEAAPAGAPLTSAEAAFKQKMGAYELYRSYVASIYGGYEQAIDAVATTGRTLELDKMAVATKEMRDLVTVLMHTKGTIYNDRLVAFLKVATGEFTTDNVAAINILQRLHIELSGYSIQQALTRLSGITEDAIPSTLQKGYANALDGVVDDSLGRLGRNFVGNESINFYTPRGGSRGIDETYKAASQQAPLFKPENFKEILVGNYYLRAQANIVDDVLFNAQVTNPELFPSFNTLQQMALDDWSVVRSGLIKGLDEEVAAGGLTPNQVAAYNVLRPQLIGETGVVRLPDGSRVLTRGAEARLSQELLISGIEDNVATISGGKGQSKRYLDTLTTFFTEDGALAALSASEKTAIRQVLGRGLDTLESKPASVYTTIFDSQARADATALFYQTSLTNVKNQLKSPFSASVQGVAEKAGTIPLLQQAQAGLKKPIFNAVNIKRTTETLQALQLSSAASKLDQYVARDGTKIADEIYNTERTLDAMLDVELNPAAIELAKRKEAVLKDLAKQSGDIQARRVVVDTIATIYDGAGNIAKNGLLGGLALPNFNYAVVNALTGPLIVAQTVGIRNSFSILSWDVLDVMKYAYSFNTLGLKGWKAPANRVILTTPDGTIYTTEMLAKLVNEGALGKSQNAAEISNNLLGATVDWAGKTGLYGDTNSIVKSARRNFVNYQDLNVWSTAANAVDQSYRMGVLVKALKEGESLENATRLARESLFDYGNLTDFEKPIASVVWFYRFKRNNFRSVFTSLANDPKALKFAFAQGQGWEYVYNFGEKTLGFDKNDVDMRFALKDYSENRAFIDLVEDPENKKRYGVYGPPVPAIQAVAEMTDYASTLLTPYILALAGEKGFFTATAETAGGIAQIATENINPMLQTGVLLGTGMDIRRGGQTASDYLDPKLVWYFQQNPEQWYTFTTYFNIEEVPYDEEKPSVGYYNGRQWRIKKGDKTAAKNWQVWQSSLLMIGVGRTMRDYAPILAQLGTAGKVASGAVTPIGGIAPKLPKAPEGKVTLPVTLDTDSFSVDFLRGVGIVTVQDAPLLEEIQKANRLKAAQELRAKPVKTQMEE